MEVTSPTSTNATQTNASSTNAATITSDFETFLRMLTVQLENQDPLNPVDADDYAVQLATFSSVEQQVLTNDLLREMTAAFNGSGLSNYADWVGRDVRAPASFLLEGEPVALAPEIASGADRAVVTVTNSAGLQITQFDVPTNSGTYIWDGADRSGRAVSDGVYNYTTTSYSGDDEIGVAPGQVYARVREAQIENGSAILILDNGSSVAADAVTAVRSADAT